MSRRARRFTGSIRFRLAAWYAALVLLVILALGAAFTVLLEQELRADVDARLERVARGIKAEIEVVQDPASGNIYGIPPPPDLYTFPSLLIQVVDAKGQVVLSSENLNDRQLPVADSPPGSADPVFTTATLDSVQVRTVRLPLVVRSTRETVGAVHVGEPLIQLDQTLAHVRRLLLIGALLGVAVAAVSGWFLAGRALRPVDRITATARAIAEDAGVGSALATRLEVGRSGDELARLAATFNRMLDRLQATFEGQRRFVADASHELRTPLTAIRGNVDVLARQVERGVPPGDLAEGLIDLRRESERMSRLVEDLLLLARSESALPDTVRVEPVRLDDVAAEVARLGAALAEGQQVELSAPAPVTVRADRDRLTQLGLILIENALRHTPATGRVTIAAEAGADGGRLIVSDTGEGIAPEHVPHIFERFYRADSSRNRNSGGTGLGLAIAKAIVERHGGTLTVRSAPEQGTIFTATIPTTSTASVRESRVN